MHKLTALIRFYLGFFLAVFATSATAQDHHLTAQSSIDWHTEKICSLLSLDAQRTAIQLPSGRNAALQILDMETPALLKDTFFSILVDSASHLGDSVEKGEISLGDLNKIIDAGKRTPPWFSPDLKQISMTHTVELASIGSLFIRHTTIQHPKAILDTIPSRAFTGILIDARSPLPVHGEYIKARLQPCLFPRIWNTDMELLYERNMVEPSIARSRGMIFYSDSSDESSYRSLIGDDPMRITARQIFGKHRTDPIIPREDYLRIMTEPANRALLTQGKIIILCDRESLEGQSLGPKKDDGYYFAWKDIGEALSIANIQKINFSDNWQGMKLTIYDIRFVADTAKILPEEKGRLDVIASALLLAGKKATFLVEGHTASVGKPTGEMTLSQDRAVTIARELAIRGIPEERIQATGHGGTQPTANNDTEEGKALNRRVEITIQLQD